MNLRNINLKNSLSIFIFFPLIFYFGKRSYLAFDEGVYALQARWILEKSNWIIPLWFDEYLVDRTIGIQVLIAKSQEIFGESIFWAYLPTTISAILMLFITYKLHIEIYDKKNPIVSPLILATTFLWFDYSHLATQDIVFSCLVTIGIFSLIKIKNSTEKFYLFLFGLWIGLAFMMKTFLIGVPILSLFPYLIKKKNLFTTKFFWLGLTIGFLPFIVWVNSTNLYLEKNIIHHLFEKFNYLSNKNNFTNPFYYYFWNIPVTFLPWSIFSIFGLIKNAKERHNHKYFLTGFPIIIISILSFFSTKTPYYPLQISSILSLNAYQGINYLFNTKSYKSITIFITSRIVPTLIFFLVLIYYFFFRSLSNFNNKENVLIILALVLLAISWSFITKKKTAKYNLFLLIIGPYLLFSLVLQSGLFTDRSRDIREVMEDIYSLNIIKSQNVNVINNATGYKNARSKIIKISLLTPKLGNLIDSVDNLKTSDLAWSTSPLLENDEETDYEIIYENKILYPWKLIKKN